MRPVLFLSGAVVSFCVARWSLTGDQTGRIASHLALYGLAFVAYLVGLRAAKGLSARGLRLALLAAVLWRAVLVPAPPLLSDDVYRYVWEGRIQLHGGNPYAEADRPDAPRWAALRDVVWQGVNHKEFGAVYPPLWQMASRAVVTLHDSVAAMKAFVVLCELLALAALAILLKRRGLPRERLLVLAWSPLALVEIAGSGHNEALGMLLVALALTALEAGWPLASAVAAAIGAQAKLLPGLIAVAWARRYRPLHVAAALAVAAALVVPYAGAGAGLWHSLSRYGALWRFNETLFAPLASLLGSQTAAVGLAALLSLLLAAALAHRGAEPASAALTVLGAWLLLAPSVLPWYALWLLPLLVLRDAPGALLFTGTAGLAYLVHPAWRSGETWQIGWGLRALEYGPCLAVAAWSWREARRRTGVAATVRDRSVPEYVR